MGQRFVCRVYGEVPIGSAAWRREEGGQSRRRMWTTAQLQARAGPSTRASLEVLSHLEARDRAFLPLQGIVFRGVASGAWCGFGREGFLQLKAIPREQITGEPQPPTLLWPGDRAFPGWSEDLGSTASSTGDCVSFTCEFVRNAPQAYCGS